MTYFVFIESDVLAVPHMEPLLPEGLDDAREEAEALLNTHAIGFLAHVFDNGDRVATVRKDRNSSSKAGAGLMG